MNASQIAGLTSLRAEVYQLAREFDAESDKSQEIEFLIAASVPEHGQVCVDDLAGILKSCRRWSAWPSSNSRVEDWRERSGGLLRDAVALERWISEDW